MASDDLWSLDDDDLEDPISLTAKTFGIELTGPDASWPAHYCENEKPKASENMTEANKNELSKKSLSVSSLEDRLHTLLLRLCRQVQVQVVKCDENLWYHRKALASQKTDPKVSLSMKKYLHKIESSQVIDDKSNQSVDLLCHRQTLASQKVDAKVSLSMEQNLDKKESSQVIDDKSNERQNGAKPTVEENNSNPVVCPTASAPEKKAQQENVSNFIVSDNSALKKRKSQMPVKLKIKEVLTFKEMSPKRLSRINFKKNKGLVGLKVLRKTLDTTEVKGKGLISQEKQKTVTSKDVALKVSAPVKKYKPGPKGSKVKEYAVAQKVSAPVKKYKPGPKGSKGKEHVNKDASKLSVPLTTNYINFKSNEVTKTDHHHNTHDDNISHTNNNTVINNQANNPIESKKAEMCAKDITSKKEKTVEKDKIEKSPSIQNAQSQVPKDIVSDVSNKTAIQETPPVITEIDTKKEIKTEPRDTTINPCPITLPSPQYSQLISPQFNPTYVKQPNVTQVNNNGNPIMAPGANPTIRPALNHGLLQISNMNHNHNLYNNGLPPTPLPSFEYFRPVLANSGEFPQHYNQQQPNWQQHQHNMNNLYQFQNQGGPPVHHYETANMHWNNTQDVPNANPQYYQNQITFGGHESMVPPLTNPINVPEINLSPQYIQNNFMMPPQTPGSPKIAAPALDTLTNNNTVSSTAQGTMMNDMHLKPPRPPPPPYERHVKSSDPPPGYASVNKAASYLRLKNAMPTACSQSNVINTHFPMHSQSNMNHNNVATSSQRKVIPGSERKKRSSHPNQYLLTSTSTKKAKILNTASANLVNAHNYHTSSNSIAYPFKNHVNYKPIDTSSNYSWHVPTQNPQSGYSDKNNRGLTNDAAEIRKVNLVAISKRGSPNILKNLLERLPHRTLTPVTTVVNPAHSNPNPKELSLPTDMVNSRNTVNEQMAVSNFKKNKPKPNKRISCDKNAPLKRTKIYPAGFVKQTEFVPKYSPPMLPIHSVEKTYEILNQKNSQQFRFGKNSLAPATMKIMNKIGAKEAVPTLRTGADSSSDKEKAAKDLKKISLKEYKKRASKPDEPIVDLTDEDINANNSNFTVSDTARHSVDSQDFGYDSDSTVKI